MVESVPMRESRTAIPRFFLYGEPPRDADERFLHVETIADRSRLYEWRIRPHAHRDLHQLLLIFTGGGLMQAETQQFAFQAPALLVAPAGVVHGFAFTPQTDRSVISPSPPNRTPITKTVPGVQLDARIADDPAGEARILIRLPDQWNGHLVVAGASGTRSEFNGDFAWSDYVVQKGYAYVSQNKGILNFSVAAPNSSTPPEPLACRLNPTSTLWVHFYANDPATPFTRWTPFMIEATRIGGNALSAHYGSTRTAPTPSEHRMADIKCGGRSRPRPSSTTAASIGKARTSIRRRRTS